MGSGLAFCLNGALRVDEVRASDGPTVIDLRTSRNVVSIVYRRLTSNGRNSGSGLAFCLNWALRVDEVRASDGPMVIDLRTSRNVVSIVYQRLTSN